MSNRKSKLYPKAFSCSHMEKQDQLFTLWHLLPIVKDLFFKFVFVMSKHS